MLRYILYGLLLLIPVVLVLKFLVQGTDPLIIFILSALAIVPLANFIGEATEELAIHIGPRWGGLLNATLGNAAELIITIFALQKGLNALVLSSITGSILGNLLLILGLSFLVGGLKNGRQKFDQHTAGLNASLSLLAVIALLIPSLFDVAIQSDTNKELRLSEGVAVVMLILYVLYVIYGFMAGKSPDHVEHDPQHLGEADDNDKQHHKAKWSIPVTIGVLAASTIGIVFMSEALVGAVEHVSHQFTFLNEVFIGLIIIPIVGNVAEHLVAVQVAYKNKMELSLAVSLGSSLQVALFVAPVLVFISTFIHPADGQPLFLVFTEFELIALVAASLIAGQAAQDGESNWFEGAMLLGVYIIIAVAFFFAGGGGEAAEAVEHSFRFLPFL